ncbi:CdaR family protein, partial [Thermohalobacter berrensis]
VELINLSAVKQEGLILMEPKEVKVSVKISGRRNDIMEITKDNVIAKADLRGYSEGKNKVPIEVMLSNNKIQIVDFSPKQVLFKFDSIVKKQKPIIVNKIGEVANGYTLGNTVLKPSSIYIEGPRSLVNSVEKVIAEVNLKNATDDIQLTVPLKVVDDRGKEITQVEISPNIVDVNIPVLRIKNVLVKPQIVGEPFEGYKITSTFVEPSIVKIKGNKKIIQDLISLNTAQIDVSYLKESIKKEVPLIVPKEVEVVGETINPVITVNIEKVESKTFEYNREDLKLINLNPELSVDKTKFPEKINVTIKAIESIINEISKNDITPYVDLSNLEEGNYNVIIEVDSPESIEVVKTEPERVDITLNNTKREEGYTENSEEE